MIGDMYTDLERSIYLHLAPKASDITVHIQQFVVPEIGQSEHPTVIDVTKMIDRFAPENGGGMGARLLTKDLDAGNATVQKWPDGFLVGYDFVVYADSLEGMRAAEVAIRSAFPPRQPMYLYDTTDPDNPVLTSTYADISHSVYVNRDDSVERRYQRHLQINFEVYNYPNTTTTVHLITQIEETVFATEIREQVITP